MESVGDEKRIRALFSEQSLEDKTRTPHFEKLWRRAEASACAPALVMKRSVPVTVASVVAVCLLVASSWYRSSQSQHAANIPPQTIPILPVLEIKQPQNFLSADSKTFRTVRRRRVARPRHAERPAANAVVAKLSTWHSPTSIFLQSPTASALSSLPQLDQSARDLETFLPKNNEVKKELK